MIFNLLHIILPAWIINIGLNLLYPISEKIPLIKKINRPLDMGMTLGKNKRRLLGNSTTFLGLIVAIGLGWIIQTLYPNIFGITIGSGMYIGHMLGSFIKRRLGYSEGQYILGLDHGDGIIVTGFLLFVQGHINLMLYISAIVITYLVYPFLCMLGYGLGLRKNRL